MQTTTPDETPQPRLRVWVLPLIGLVVVSVVGGIIALPTLLTKIPLPQFHMGSEQEPPSTPAKLGQDFAPAQASYGPPEPVPAPPPAPELEVKPAPQPPVAQYVQRAMPPAENTGKTEVMLGAMLSSLHDIAQKLGSGAGTPNTQPAQSAQPATVQAPTAGTPRQDRKKRDWETLAKDTQAPAPREQTENAKKDNAEKDTAKDLIKPARWAIPIAPLQTIYRSMRMTGRLLDSINTDIPASTIRIELTEDLKDKFHYDQTIFPKTTIVIAQQVGKAEFGQKRVPLKIEQFEPPTGEVIKVDGGIGDKAGAAGVPGKVNAHIPELLLATGINAMMQLGLGYATGTPGQGQFYQDPAQRAGQEAGNSVARDVNEYTRQVLKRPPTIEVEAFPKKAKDIPVVTIFLTENIQMNRPPLVAK